MSSLLKNRGLLSLLRRSHLQRNYSYHLLRSQLKTAQPVSQIRRQQTQTQSAVQTKTSALERAVIYKVGDKLNGFTIKEIQAVPEFQLVAIRLEHEVTGGEYLHIFRDDSNNAFSVGFRTTPTDSTGLPHILEHTTLCGSQRYPCRDPFFKMRNRSLATYMNAGTGPDYTVYPFSTQNGKDYHNLMSVYLDAVFRPQLKETDFQQEGWRLEHSDPNDPQSPIIFKGVVFNEMKGVFADNQNIFAQALQSYLLPTHTYSVCSGGDPLVIPTLTHNDLKSFHKRYYAPPNTKYYSYGNFPLEDHLKYINEEYLKEAKGDKTLKAITEVPSEERWTKSVRKHITCRVDPMAADQNKQSSIAISYLCCEITDIDEDFLLLVLTELLVKGPHSAFYKTLIEPNIGAGFSPTTGYECYTRDTFFSVGLQGISDKDFDKIIDICDKTFDEVIEKGFKKEQIEAILHSIELNTKHQSSNFGLGLLFRITPLWNHDGDVLKLLQIEKRVENFKENLKRDPEYLQKKVKRYFKDNKHKLILTMSPDPDYDQKLQEKERLLLEEKLGVLNEDGKKMIYESGLKLLNEQKKDDKACLPTLKLDDLRKDIDYVPYSYEKIEGVPFQIVPQPTNGITYFRGILCAGQLKEELKSYLPLFSMISTRMGTKKHNYKDFDQLATLKTSGLAMKMHFMNDMQDSSLMEESLVIGSHCLNKNLKDMFELWTELFQECDFKDAQRFETLVKSEAANLVNGIADGGHHYAMLSAASLISPLYSLKERSGGLTYVNYMKKIAQGDPQQHLSQMMTIYKNIMTRRHFRCSLNILENTESEVLKEASCFIKSLPGTLEKPMMFEQKKLEVNENKGVYHVLPFPISFTSKSVVGVPFKHEDYAPLQILTNLVSTKYLHGEIREKGGAYGGGATTSASGLILFYSYRDPNPENSHLVYDNTSNWLKSGKFTEEDVDEAKLLVFQGIDSPVPPGSKGMLQFLDGISDKEFQNHRLRLMAVKKEDLFRVCEKYLDESQNKSIGRVIIGPENKSIIDNVAQSWKVDVQD